jgi:hypothetical protein
MEGFRQGDRSIYNEESKRSNYYSNLTATRMEDIAIMEEMDKTIISHPLDVVLHRQRTTTYCGDPSWKRVGPNSGTVSSGSNPLPPARV